MHSSTYSGFTSTAWMTLRNTWLLPTGRLTSFSASPIAMSRALSASTNMRCSAHICEHVNTG
jgi:hypothetical protein